MRIRKRFLSLSAAVTAPPSLDLHGDVHHQSLLLVQQPQLHPNGNRRVLYDNSLSKPSDPPQPPSSDHTTQIGVRPSTWVSSVAGSHPSEPIVFPQKESEEKTKKETIEDNDSGRKERSKSSAEVCSHHLVLKGWFEGGRLIPVKKRRGSFGKRMTYDHSEDHEKTEGKIKMKPKKDEREMAIQEISETCTPKKNKNTKRGNVIMEGSRCSRVNGRGWRCCQQTLVGYSLCEHHLGKGRLRSVTGIRGRAQKVAPKEQDEEFEDDDDEFKDWEKDYSSSGEDTKNCSKKKKLGVVKARSLSILLSQIGS